MSVWTPESLYFKSLSYSGLLMTTALLFYHMTKSRTLEMNPIASGVFSIIMILISIAWLIIATVSYRNRLIDFQRSRLNAFESTIIKNEFYIYIPYVVLGILLVLVEIGIGFFIIYGVVRRSVSPKMIR